MRKLKKKMEKFKEKNFTVSAGNGNWVSQSQALQSYHCATDAMTGRYEVPKSGKILVVRLHQPRYHHNSL